MTWLRKVPNSRSAPPGLEWWLLRRMPRVLVAGTLLPPALALLARVGGLDPGDLALIDIYAFGLVILHWTLVLTASLACFIVLIMKGPVYRADSYPLPDAERPAPRGPSGGT